MKVYNFQVQIPDIDRTVSVKADADKKLRVIMQSIVGDPKLGLPKTNYDGTTIQYALMRGDSNLTHGDIAVEESGISDNDLVVLKALNKKLPPLPKEPKKKSSLMLFIILGAVLILGAATVFALYKFEIIGTADSDDTERTNGTTTGGDDDSADTVVVPTDTPAVTNIEIQPYDRAGRPFRPRSMGASAISSFSVSFSMDPGESSDSRTVEYYILFSKDGRELTKSGLTVGTGSNQKSYSYKHTQRYSGASTTVKTDRYSVPFMLEGGTLEVFVMDKNANIMGTADIRI